MSKPHIAVILGSIRSNRLGIKPAQWILDHAKTRTDMTVELVDLKDYPLPLFDEVASNAYAPTQNPVGQKWQKKLAEFDGYIFVTAEYNRSVPGALKNAIDFAYPEWNRKAAAFVGYGSVGGARAVEHLRGISAELQMATVRQAVHIQGNDFFEIWQKGKNVSDFPYLDAGAKDLLDNLVWWASALKTARAQS